jgi:hypothetical protein
MDKKMTKCIELMRGLVSDIQGAPYPGDEIKSELYSIWYEHVQRDAVNAFEYLDENFTNHDEIIKAIDSLLK